MTDSVQPGSVVVGVDGSPQSDTAIAWAVEYARARNAPLLVVNGAGDDGSVMIPDRSEAREMLSRHAHEITHRALGKVRELAPDLDVAVAMPYEDPRQALLDLAVDAPMMVVGTRGRGPVKSLLMGSTSIAVAEHAKCPVTVVRAGDPKHRNEDGHVVVGVAVTENPSVILDIAFDLASQLGRPLDVVHACGAYDDTLDKHEGRENPLDVVEQHSRFLDHALERYTDKYTSVQVDRQMPDRDASEVLVECSETAAHLVVGSHGRTGIGSVLGSVSRAVLERAHCPVTVARTRPPVGEGQPS
ncbi:MAG: universal stress protein [Nocardioidaceae bacterium]